MPAYEIELKPLASLGQDTSNFLVEPLSAARPLPLQQHPLYGSALQDFGADVSGLVITGGGKTLMRCQLVKRRFFGLFTVSMVFRGPEFRHGLSDSDKKELLTFLRKQFSPWRRQFLLLMPELEDAPTARRLFSRSGFTRIMTGSSTVWVDLEPDETDLRKQLDGTWRNQLRKAEKQDMQIAVGGAKAKHYNWILEKEESQRRVRGYAAVPVGIVPAYARAATEGVHADRSAVLSVTAHRKGSQIAGALFLLHGTGATYHIGWTGESGRVVNAQNRVIFEAMMALKARGIRWLDLGGLDTGPQAGIARFKLGLGHKPTTLAGTWIG